MEQTQPSIAVGQFKLTPELGGVIAISHAGKAGEVRVYIDSARLERWCLRIMREEAFAVETKTPE